MFCEHCGKQIDNDSSFCAFCGSKVAVDGFQQNVDTVQEPSDDSVIDDTVYEDEACENNGGYQNQYEQYPDGQYEQYSQYPDEQYNQYPYGQYEQYNQYPEQQYAVGQPPVKKKSGGKIVGIIVAVVAVVIVIGVAAVFLLGRVGTSGTDVNSQKNDAVSQQGTSADEKENFDIGNANGTLDAYDSGTIIAPEKLYNDVDYYIGVDNAALYSGPASYSSGQIALFELNDIVTVKGGMEDDSSWVYVYSEKHGIYGWIDVTLISESMITGPVVIENVYGVNYFDESARYYAYVDVGEGHNLNLRTRPVEDSTSAFLLIPDGHKVFVVGRSIQNSDWCYVYYEDPVSGILYYGFAHGDYLER